MKKINLNVKNFVIAVVPILVLSVGVLVAAQGKDTFKTKELSALENYKADLEKKGQPIPEEINKKIDLETKESKKLAMEKSKRDQEVIEMKKKIADAPKDAKGKAILEDEPKPQNIEPYEDVGKVNYDKTYARTFFVAHSDEKYEFASTLTAPQSKLISGNIKNSNSTGFIYIVNNDPNLDPRIEHLYPDVGVIRLEKLTQNDTIAIFSYGNGKEGYFDISKNTAYFTPYSAE